MTKYNHKIGKIFLTSVTCSELISEFVSIFLQMRRQAIEYVATTSSLPWALVAAHGGTAEDSVTLAASVNLQCSQSAHSC